MAETSLKRWLVQISTPNGEAELEVPTFCGPEAAERRAIVAAASLGWGDLDEIRILNVSEATEEGR